MLWQRKRQSRDFDEELQSHLQHSADQFEENGMTRKDAEAAARRAFGNVTRVQEDFYFHRRSVWRDQFQRDFTFGLRLSWRQPAFSMVAALTLALGIGATTAIFSVVNAVLLRPYLTKNRRGWRCSGRKIPRMVSSRGEYRSLTQTDEAATFVAQRTNEIGLRMALGARQTDVITLILRQGLKLVGFGIVIGSATALATTRLLSSLLYGVSANNPITFFLAPIVLLTVASFATWPPAHRASRIDPMLALRQE